MAFDKRRTRFKKRSCRFCGNKEITVDYKNIDLLRNYVSESGKIEPRRATGTCAKHQRLVSNEIKKARQMALIAYVVD